VGSAGVGKSTYGAVTYTLFQQEFRAAIVRGAGEHGAGEVLPSKLVLHSGGANGSAGDSRASSAATVSASVS